MRKKRKLRLWVKVTLPVLLGLCLGPFVIPKNRTPEPMYTEAPVLLTEPIRHGDELRKELMDCISMNPEVKGLLLVGDLIHEPVLQAADNSTYLYKDWKTGSERSYGSVFLDYRCNENSQNQIIYGHYVYEKANRDRTLAFTPLALLNDRRVFETCKTIDFVTVSGIDRYKLLGTMDVRLELCGQDYLPPSHLAYNEPEYGELDLSEYRKNAENNWVLRSDVKWLGNERLLTLQTCIEGQPEKRQVVVAIFDHHIEFSEC